MRTIDLQTWSRRQHFNFFIGFDHPQFSMCANVDLSEFYPAIKQHGISFTIAVVYLIARAANAIPEFRYRLRGETVVEHEVVHPSATFLARDDLFTFCTFDYDPDFTAFATQAAEEIRSMQADPSVENLARDDMLYMSSIPWVSFTSFEHPLHLSPLDSVPRFAWGKYFEEGGRLKMPLNVLAHHALMDGYHMGRFYTLIQEYFDQPEVVTKIDNE